MVFILPNPHTGYAELFWAEVVQNVEGVIDPFCEPLDKSTYLWHAKSTHVRLFRFWERLHTVRANKIAYCPLKQAMDEVALSGMLKKLWEMHGNMNTVHEFNNPIKESIQKSNSDIHNHIYVHMVSWKFCAETVRFSPPNFFHLSFFSKKAWSKQNSVSIAQLVA